METIYKNLIQKLAEEKRDVSQKNHSWLKKSIKTTRFK